MNKRENRGFLTKTRGYNNLDHRFMLSHVRAVAKKNVGRPDGLVSLGISTGVLVWDLLRSSNHPTNRVGITYPKEKPSKLQVAESASLLSFTVKELLESSKESRQRC